MNSNLLKALEVFKNGGIVIFPTDTAFGIGCRIDSESSVERLFKIRKRPNTQATPVLVNGIDMARKYLMDIPQDVKDKLINNYWPGALTVILNCKKEKVPSLVRGGKESLGVRMPDQEDILSIIEILGVPILGPSANFHGEKTPYSLEELDPKLTKLADYVLDGKTKTRQPSTVIDCTKKPWQILRKGAIEVNI